MTSRVCVKNLPRYLTEDRLREHFAAKGEVTDAKILKTQDGKSRQFGFVGYKTQEQAQAAVSYFHKSFLDTSRLLCELAQPIGDPNLGRPWSRHSEGSSAYEKANRNIEATSENSNSKPKTMQQRHGKGNSMPGEDPKLIEFLQVMQPRSKTKLWTNDTLIGPSNATNVITKQTENDHNKTKKVEVEIVDGVNRRIPIGKGKTNEKLARLHVRFEGESDGEDSSSDQEYCVASQSDKCDNMEENARAVKEKEDAALLSLNNMSDVDYLRSRMTKDWDEDEDEDEDKDGDQAEHKTRDMKQLRKVEAGKDGGDERSDEQGPDVELEMENNAEINEATDHDFNRSGADTLTAENLESVSETGRIFVRNLPYTASEEDLAELFGRCGEVSQVHLVLDKETKRSKGFGYVLFMVPEDAKRALEELDKSIFQGRLLHILPARRLPFVTEKKQLNGVHTGDSKFKQDREAQKKAAEASGDDRAWNSLYMRPDTVAEVAAKQYGVSKSEFLDPGAEDLAVRLALGETHIIAQTKEALSKEGVNTEVLEDVASGKHREGARSNIIILVKNLPFTTEEEDLLKMFGSYGSIGRIILPPTKAIAIVEFLETSEARAAFRGLAYRRFKHVPLYLEWAPHNLLSAKVPKVDEDKPLGKGQIRSTIMQEHAPDEDELEPAKIRAIFIKNLNFKTTEASLQKHFESQLKKGAIRKVTIKKEKSKSGKILSKGFGFIEFDSFETAKEACKELQGTILEGHALILQLSYGNKKETKPAGHRKEDKNESSTKMIIRNVAFEATKKDLRQLFTPFGQIKSLRLPKKFDGNHRGFAFIEFLTKQEAQNAYDALKDTHLYGRHLVLERAKENETIEELRVRTALQFVDDQHASLNSSKKRKYDTLMDNVNVPFRLG